MLLIPGDKLILHSFMKDSLLMVRRPEFHYSSRWSGSAKVLLLQQSMCKSLKLSRAEEKHRMLLSLQKKKRHKSDPDILPKHFVKARSVLSVSQAECSLFSLPLKQDSMWRFFFFFFFFWRRFLKKSINHSDFLSRIGKKYMWVTPIWQSSH